MDAISHDQDNEDSSDGVHNGMGDAKDPDVRGQDKAGT